MILIIIFVVFFYVHVYNSMTLMIDCYAYVRDSFTIH